MKAGSLDRRITLQRQGTATDDGYTTQPGAWFDLAEVWASYRPGSGRELLVNDEIAAPLPVEFRIRKSLDVDDLNPKDRLLYSGIVHDIKSVTEIAREGLLIIAVARPDAQ